MKIGLNHIIHIMKITTVICAGKELSVQKGCIFGPDGRMGLPVSVSTKSSDSEIQFFGIRSMTQPQPSGMLYDGYFRPGMGFVTDKYPEKNQGKNLIILAIYDGMSMDPENERFIIFSKVFYGAGKSIKINILSLPHDQNFSFDLIGEDKDEQTRSCFLKYSRHSNEVEAFDLQYENRRYRSVGGGGGFVHHTKNIIRAVSKVLGARKDT